MIRVEHMETWGFSHAVRGMRNPMNSWDRSDSRFDTEEGLSIGEKDLVLMQKLFRGGTEHRKYLRQIMVAMDVTAPLYWWKEFDTYKVGTTANSCSTMHKIAAKPFTRSDFSCEHLHGEALSCLDAVCAVLNENRTLFLQEKDKQYWWNMIQLLPTSYQQKRTVTMNYENVVTILRQRRGHKLDEWNSFCDILETLPYVRELLETVREKP